MNSESVEASFDILERIGKGSFGAVYKAINKLTGQTVALKRILLEVNFVKEIIQEIKILEQCDSPYIVKYYQHYIKKENDGPKLDDYFYISMEYCALGSVGDIMEVIKRPLSEKCIAAICYNVLLGLDYLFQNRKIHRDIKPDNILLTEKGEPKLGDFGVAGVISSVSSRRNTITGTPYYIAPEVLDERQLGYDFKADIWSLGISAIEMAEEEPPLYGLPPLKVLTMIPKRDPPRLKDPQKWSPAFQDFVSKMLTFDPQFRPNPRTLLQHAFLQSVDVITDLAPLVQEVNKRVNTAGNLEKALLAQTEHIKRTTIKAVKARLENVDWAENFRKTPEMNRHILAPKRKIKVDSFSNLNFDEPVSEVGNSETSVHEIAEISDQGIVEVSESKLHTLNNFTIPPPPPPPPDGFVGIYRPNVPSNHDEYSSHESFITTLQTNSSNEGNSPNEFFTSNLQRASSSETSNSNLNHTVTFTTGSFLKDPSKERPIEPPNLQWTTKPKVKKEKKSKNKISKNDKKQIMGVLYN